MSLSEAYLLERGILRQTADDLEFELDTSPMAFRINSRLNRNDGELLLHTVQELIWCPLCDSAGTRLSWIARPLPSPDGS